MPKLPLDPDRLRALSRSATALAREAVRHPRRTVTQAVSGTVEIVGAVTHRGSATTGRPSAEATVQTTPTTPAPTTPAVEEPADAAPAAEPPAAAPATEPPVEPPEEHLTGPAPHMPAGLAKDIERDFDEDIPGIKGRRES